VTAADRDVLARLARLQEADELQAALLAVIAPADSAASFIVWSRETEAIPSAPLLRADVTELPDTLRLPCLDALLERMRRQPTATRTRLLEGDAPRDGRDPAAAAAGPAALAVHAPPPR
jgi:hypothetical protein